MNFQKVVLIIAAIILVVFLVIFLTVLLRDKKTEQWPPMVGDCPDYWVDTKGSGGNCVNTYNLGTCSSQSTMDFTTPAFTGTNGTCAKYNWANSCGLSWDGITYGVTNPCLQT